jgi:hypothetical protein
VAADDPEPDLVRSHDETGVQVVSEFAVDRRLPAARQFDSDRHQLVKDLETLLKNFDRAGANKDERTAFGGCLRASG